MTRPMIPFGAHPIEQGVYVLPTLEIHRLMDKIVQIITDGGPGMIVYGRPRLGKTKATTFAVNYLPEVLQYQIPVFVADSKSYKVPSAEKFFRDMLLDFNYGFSTKKDEIVLRNQIVSLMHEKAERCSHRRVALLMDEAHKMTEWQYDCLIDIYNQLLRRNVRMTTISIGQEQLVARRTFFLANSKTHIIGRFMPSEYRFRGVTNEEEMEFVLQSYDESEFPSDSGWFYTRYYFPEAYDTGKRIAEFSKSLFNLFIEIRQEYGLSGRVELPMEYLAFTVENALKINGANGKCTEWLSMEQWREAIQRSGYIESEIYMAIAKKAT
ncbi:MAG: AAA family ATPase [Candidatus Pristimantibacillus sp.]